MNLDSRKLYLSLEFTVVILSFLFIYQFSLRSSWQVDFTEEKRYTLHSSVQQLLESLRDPISVEVFLDGELPSNFKRLQSSILETLNQFEGVAGNKLQFRFTDPSIASSNNARNQFYRRLIDKGIQPSNVTYSKSGEKTEKLVFPGVILSYRGEELGITLLKGNRARSIEAMLNQSIEGLQYELANGIRQLTQSYRNKIGYVVGHGEPDSTELAGFTNAILSGYELFTIDLASKNTPILGYDVLIIGKSTGRFEEYEKYLLDQYVMNGGKLLIFIDALSVNMQEAGGEGTIAFPYDLNLDDLFFNYGIRVNKDYVADVNCGNTPVVTGMVGDQPRIELLPWPYWPVITNYSKNPIVRNLDATWFRGASTIDTVKAVGIKKTPLLWTSQYSKVFGPPVRISYNDLQDKLRPDSFTAGPKSLGYLLEGRFESLYRNRFLPGGVDKSDHKEMGVSSKIIIISDGDFIRNDFSLDNDNPLPMGMDPYSQTTYANEDFLINALDYLTDDLGLMASRNRELKIRPLDKVKIQEDSQLWKWINIGIPLVFIITFGMVKHYWRRYRYR